MKISLKLLAKFIDVTPFLSEPQKLSDLLTNGGLEVEGIVNQAEAYKNVVTGHILEKDKHPNADQLSLCKVSTGDKEHSIVCGAKNHKAGDKVVVALPGAVLPGDFAIKVSKIRGVESQGMLCSEKELGLTTTTEGIVILPEGAPIGESFAKYYKLDDVVLDIKVTPNRSDCLSHLGLAREINALLGAKPIEFKPAAIAEGRESTKKLSKVTVEDSERCPRYAGRVVQNLKIGPSPEWLKKALEVLGLRSINNVVDVTNYVMMELGQPLHAFDLAKLKDGQVIIRGARAGETIKTLDEKDLKLDGTELMICDSEKPVAIAGVMGGFDSGVTEATKDIFVESAYFIPSTVRRTARLHGMESDSSYRFSRGVDPEGVVTALNRACQLLTEVAQGTVCMDFFDVYPRPGVRPRIELDVNFISARLGVKIESNEAKRLLERIGCSVSGTDKLLVNPPAYRVDLKIAEDLGEELLRLKGFSQIPETLPAVRTEPTNNSIRYILEMRLAKSLTAQGIHQACNWNIVSSTHEKKVLGDSACEKAVRVANPLNNEMDILRVSVIPALLKNVIHNTQHGEAHGALFEIAPVFLQKETADIREEKRPFFETTQLGLVLWGGEPAKNWQKNMGQSLFYELKGVVEGILEQWRFKSFKFESAKDAPGYFHPGQTARLVIEGKPAGFVGVLHPAVQESLDIKTSVVVCELSTEVLFTGQPRITKAKPVPKFPKVDRDVALLAPTELAAQDIGDALLKAAGQLAKECELFDLYEGDKLPKGKKSVAYRLTYQDPSKTLSDDEINALHKKAVDQVCQKLGLAVR